VSRSPVAVVIPAYQAGPFIEETIESVLAQHPPVSEIVVVDDGSTDDTAERVARYGHDVRYVRQDNRGVSAARNHGLRETAAEFVCFLDADDWLYPDNFRLKMEALWDTPQAALAHGLVEVTGPELEPTGEVLTGADGDVLDDLLGLIPPALPCPSNVLVRRAVLDEVGGFDEQLGTAADFDMWLRIAAKYPVVRVDEVLAKYRRHEGAMFSNLEAQVKDMAHIFAKHRKALGRRASWRTLLWRFNRSIAGAYHHRGQNLLAARYVLRGMGGVVRARLGW